MVYLRPESVSTTHQQTGFAGEGKEEGHVDLLMRILDGPSRGGSGLVLRLLFGEVGLPGGGLILMGRVVCF